MAETKDTGTVSGSAADENGEEEMQHSTKLSESQKKFRDFFAERKDIKRKEYVRFASVGWYLFFIGCVIGAVSFVIILSGTDSSITYAYVVGLVLIAIGIILVSLVPVDEIDLETELSRENHRCRRTVVVGGVGITLTVVMIGFLSVPPYFVQAIMILQGVLIMDDNNCHSAFFERIGVPGYLHPPKEFTLKVAQYVILLPMCFGLSTFMIGIGPRFYLDHCLIEGTCNSGFVTDAVIRHFNIWQIALIIVGIGTTLMTLIAMYMYWFRMREIHDAEGANKRPKGIETACLFDSIYCTIIALAITNIGYGGASAIAQIFYDAKAWTFMQWFQVGFGIFQVLAIMLVLLVGKEECFSVLDRYMEFDVERLMDDGSLLAELASSSENFEKGDNYWVYREKEFSDVLSQEVHHIKREFFIKATIAEVTEHDEIRHSKSRASENGQTSNEASVQVSLKLEVDVKEDCSPWVAKYNEIEIEIDNQHSLDEAPFDLNDRSVDKWMEHNLVEKTCKDISVNPHHMVKFHVDLPVQDKKKAQLLEWAKDNVRYYEVEKTLPADVFSKSPRDIAKEDLVSTYAKSKPRTIEKKTDKIDYFVSHSWAERDEVKQEKKKVLEQFGQEFFKKHKRMPTVWLDKYCIDQKDSGNDISVIPIYISCCTKILVLLTPSYMQRLWCIWELFTLFIFAKKELAVRRLEIRVVGMKDGQEDGQYESFLKRLQDFDPNDAHCFSPQEEMKLRKIMHDIGKEKLEEIKDEIRNMLEGKMKDRNIWCACSDTTGKDSTEETLSSTHNPVNEPAMKRDASIVDVIPPPSTIEEGIELGNVREVC